MLAVGGAFTAIQERNPVPLLLGAAFAAAAVRAARGRPLFDEDDDAEPESRHAKP